MFSFNVSRYFILALLLRFSTAIQLWSGPSVLPAAIPASCRVALSANITCSPRLITAGQVSSQASFSDDYLEDYCTSGCYSSLLSYKTAVDLRCGNTVYAFNPYINQSGSAVSDPLLWAYNASCIRDSTTSDFCIPEIRNQSLTMCSDCTLKYGAQMLDSTYGAQAMDADTFSSMISSCSAASTDYPYNTPTTSAITVTTTTSSTTSSATCTGTTYTVADGDTCESISEANSVSIDRLQADNNLDYNCTTLIVGNTLCIGSTCDLLVLSSNSTCADIVAGQNYTTYELVSWNPIIHTACDNIAALVGRSICISPPGSTWDFADDPQGIQGGTTTTDSVTFVVPTNGSWVTAASSTATENFTTSWYASTALDPPVTSTDVYNQTNVDAWAARVSYCPWSGVDPESVETQYWELSDACLTLLDPYCSPTVLTGTIPTSRRFPASCSPVVDAITTSASSTASTTVISASATAAITARATLI